MKNVQKYARTRKYEKFKRGKGLFAFCNVSTMKNIFNVSCNF